MIARRYHPWPDRKQRYGTTIHISLPIDELICLPITQMFPISGILFSLRVLPVLLFIARSARTLFSLLSWFASVRVCAAMHGLRVVSSFQLTSLMHLAYMLLSTASITVERSKKWVVSHWRLTSTNDLTDQRDWTDTLAAGSDSAEGTWHC